MTARKHVELVRRGTEAIREWREKHKGQILNLSKARLDEAGLKNADLQDTELSGASLRQADLSYARLTGAHLIVADLHHANLSSSDMAHADLLAANLEGADLSGANLRFARIVLSPLPRANLSNSDLSNTIFCQSSLRNVNFTEAKMDATVFTACEFSECLGLETVKHVGPSSMGIDTLIVSFRAARDCFSHDVTTFFVNAGVPKQLLDKIPEILAEVRYFSCFVTYGDPDRAFAERLVRDLRAKGVSAWLYSYDYTPGARTWKEIGKARRKAEKMIVLCSARSLIRDGVLKEIEEQIDENPDKILPISLDNLWQENGFLVRRAQRDLKPFLLERNYADFADEPAYEKSLQGLLRGIRK